MTKEMSSKVEVVLDLHFEIEEDDIDLKVCNEDEVYEKLVEFVEEQTLGYKMNNYIKGGKIFNGKTKVDVTGVSLIDRIEIR